MSLQVRRILHVETSLYQDVLVFESETYGNVLVLDGVIQCTERDEFSYQEMIAHLPLASHPNPEKVLVIGGGDGGVVREVLKHPSVKSVVLCDIDEAVVRVARQFFPHMSALLTDPRVTVTIGDGAHFLARTTAAYDVIITDSSDPVGPAAALFEPPYFARLHAALAPGGHIASQIESLWIALPPIGDLLRAVRAVFPVAEYAFAAVPTYPSGQIGLLVGAKAPGRGVRAPLRAVAPTRYYNAQVHRAAFVLPEFGRAFLEQGSDVTPEFGTAAGRSRPAKRVLLLGGGPGAQVTAEYLARAPENTVTIASCAIQAAPETATDLPNTTTVSLDVTDTSALENIISGHDVVISFLPDTYHDSVM